MRVRLIAFVLTAVAVLSGSGCGSDSKPAATTVGSPVGAAAGSGPGSAAAKPQSGAAAAPAQPAAPPDLLVFTAITIDRKPVAGVTLLGKPAVLWFWAADCADCRAQGAETDKVALLTSGRANVLGVAAAGDPAALRDFVTATKASAIPHLADSTGALWTRFEVTHPGTYIVLDSTGAVAYRGVLPRAEGLLDRVTPLTR